MSRWRLSKKFTFEASHQLPLHDGKCKRLHGHSWVGHAVCEGFKLQEVGPKSGMLVDYGDIGALVKALCSSFLDHYHLNDSLCLPNPTSEEIARWVYFALKPKLPSLVAVVIEETCTSRCEYAEPIESEPRPALEQMAQALREKAEAERKARP